MSLIKLIFSSKVLLIPKILNLHILTKLNNNNYNNLKVKIKNIKIKM